MKKSLVSTLALSALVAGALIGSAAGQTAGVGVGTPIGQPGILIAPGTSQPGSIASTGVPIATGTFGSNSGLGIGPGMLAGAGPRRTGWTAIYAEAPPRVRAALSGRVNPLPGLVGLGRSAGCVGRRRAKGRLIASDVDAQPTCYMQRTGPHRSEGLWHWRFS